MTTAPSPEKLSIVEPCVVDGMSEAEYHGDPVPGGSLNSSGAKLLLRSPAHYKHQQQNRADKSSFDLGHAVHSMILGVGLDVVAIPEAMLASNGAASTKEAKTFIAEARAEGKVPLKAEVVAECKAMVESVFAHPLACSLLERPGKAEQSIFAQDPETKVWLRARIDHLPDVDDGQTVILDLKTAVSADPRDFARSASEYGYDIQSQWYQRVVQIARGDKDTSFRFIVIEKSAPYLTSVIELDSEFAAIGRTRMRRAIETFKECRDADEWPGYEPIAHLVGPPAWLAYQEGMVI